jgi:penicillin-binding protein 1A
MLAGLLKAPSRFSPTSDIARAQARANVVRRDGGHGRAHARAGGAGAGEPGDAVGRRRAPAGRAVRRLRDGAGPAYLTADTTEDVTIRTTFDPAAQRAAEAALREVFERRCGPARRRRRPSW